MEKPFCLSIEGNKGKILHITDCHLFSGDQGCLLGVNTNASFDAVIDRVERQADRFDLIIATGDFVQDGSKEAYLRFANKIKKLQVPCFWLPGNHDVCDNMKAIFEQQGLPEKKLILVGEQWLIVMLNSQKPGQAYGLLSDVELTFLANTLANCPQYNIGIFLHHHPIMSGCRWLDQHCLKNSKEFGELIQRYNNVKTIGWGHIHQQNDQQWYGCHVFSTPSTCIQFERVSDAFKVSNESPGWRFIELHDNGEITTSVHRLDDHLFEPDLTIAGY